MQLAQLFAHSRHSSTGRFCRNGSVTGPCVDLRGGRHLAHGADNALPGLRVDANRRQSPTACLLAVLMRRSGKVPLTSTEEEVEALLVCKFDQRGEGVHA